MITRPYLVAMAGLVLASLVVGAAFYPRLPETVPTHWNLHGEADGFGSRWVPVLMMPAINAGLAALLVVLPLIGPFRANFEKFKVTYGRMCVTIIAAMLAFHVIILLKSAGHPLQIGATCSVVVGLLLAMIGNWMGKVRRNFYVGVRTPWTLANEVVWERTHRVSAKVFVIHGLISAIVGLLGLPDWVCFAVLVGGAIAGAVWAVIYSYVIYRRVGSVDDLPLTESK